MGSPTMEVLRLTLPARQQGAHLLVETHPGSSRRWLESLPYGDMRQTLPQVLRALSGLNRSELSAQQRMALMPDYENSVHLIADYYRRADRRVGHQRPTLHERLELQQLTREMAFAYKLIISEQAEKRSGPPKSSKPLLKALHGALHYLGLMFMGHYENYAPVPAPLWRELYALYSYALRHDLSDFEIEASEIRSALPTIAAEFKRICLLAISDPYHLSRSEHWEIHDYLSQWVHLSELTLGSDTPPSRHHFLIDLTGGKPVCQVPGKLSGDGPRLWLGTEALVKRVQQHLDSLALHGGGPFNIGFSHGLANREIQQILLGLQRSWDEVPERSTPRYAKINRVDVIWNLAAIHSLFRAIDPLTPGQPELPPRASTFERANDIAEAPRSGWDALNGSEGGLCLSQHGNSTQIHQLEVGQLAALREHIDGKPSSRWALGVLRWLHADQRQTMLGIEFIKGDVQVVNVHALEGNKIETRPKPAFLISGQKVQGKTTPTVIAPRGLYRENRPLCLQIGDEQLYIQAKNRVEVTGSFERFFYQAFQPNELQRPDPDPDDDEVITYRRPGDRGIDWDTL